MQKAYYIFNGNRIIDVLLGENKEQQVEISVDLYNKKYSDTWIKHEVIELEVTGEAIQKGDNLLQTVILNNKPIAAFINENSIFEYTDDEYRKYTYRTDEIWVS